MRALAAVRLLVAALIAALPAGAAEVLPRGGPIPEPLEPWVGWVLDGKEASACATLPGAPDAPRCQFPTRLGLDLGPRGGDFTLEVQVDAPGWVPLPGDATRFPLDVKVDGKPAVVLVREGVPALRLPTGRRRVEGTFRWDTLPDSLPLPKATALLRVSVGGKRIAEPSRGDDGRLFLQQRDRTQEGEQLEIVVHRKLLDEVPFELATRLVLNVAGRSRELVLGRSLPPGFVPTAIESELPARIEADSRLRVQARPGTFTIQVSARSTGPIATLTRPDPAGPWREGEEVWVFEARPSLRVVTVEGARAVDPQQTSLPEEWRALPAYAVAPGEGVTLVERRRGDAEQEEDPLRLSRTLWLDFDGGGLTARDRITGTLRRPTRLEMQDETALGRLRLDGRDQFITRGPSGRAGVELPPGPLSLAAESRLPGTPRDLPLVSWDHDFREVDQTLHLPPGYRLLHVSGADEVPGTWLRHWNLLDIFLLLVLALAFGKLWGARWGLVAGAGFLFCFPEAGFPTWAFPPVLVAAALHRVVPEGRLRRAMAALQIASLLALAVGLLPFVVEHVRFGLYPALAELGGGADPERDADGVLAAAAGGGGMAEEAAQEAVPGTDAPAAPEPKGLYDNAKVARGSLAASVAKRLQYSQRNTEIYDPDAVVQTGPGLPRWSWQSTTIRVSGPVEAGQRLSVHLLPPGANLALSLLRALLVAALFARLLPGLPWPPLGRPRAAAAASLLLLGLASPTPARAEIPSTELLTELERRLLEKPDCAPACASIPRMSLDVARGELTARIEIHVAASAAVPLPGSASQWTPDEVTVDGQAERTALLRADDGSLFLRLPPGRHEVVASGPLAARDSITLALPLRPHHVEATVSGYLLEGLHEDGQADDHLRLTRQAEAATDGGTALVAGTLPPFARVERTLHFGLDWQAETRVIRVTPTGGAVVLEVPLLPGESVTTEGVRVSGDRALVNMPPGVAELRWHSVVAQRSPLRMTAPPSAPWTEVWRLDVGPLWHADLEGIPSTRAEPEARLPEYRPWPGEALSLALSRLPGMTGQSLTLDEASLTFRPGLRATDATLAFTARSSRGGEHVIRLPEGAELDTVSVNGAPRPVRRNGQEITLPISPGSERFKLSFRLAEGVTTAYRPPSVDLGAPAVNVSTIVELSDSRWLLWLRGPRLGPAVLFWSLLLVLLAVAHSLGRIRWVPLARHEWLVLSMGLSQVPVGAALLVVAWLLALGQRREHPETTPTLFDLRQLLLVGWTLAALAVLVAAVHEGLLGAPDMQIRGNDSHAGALRWFEDRVGGVPASPLVVSVPMLAYRGAMLAWALWLASAMLRWLRFAWEAFSTGGIWRPRRPRVTP